MGGAASALGIKRSTLRGAQVKLIGFIYSHNELRCPWICRRSAWKLWNQEETDMAKGIRFTDAFNRDAVAQVVGRG